jgi:hypothetical protein
MIFLHRVNGCVVSNWNCMSGHPHPSASISEIGKEIAFGRLAESLLKFPPPFLSLEMGVQVFFYYEIFYHTKEIRRLEK